MVKMCWLTTLDPLESLLASNAYFQLKWPYLKYFSRIGYREPKQFQSKWPRWFFLVHWNTFLPQSKQNSKLSFFAFLQVPIGVCGIFRPPVQGGSNELISKFLSSMILYNHPSYFKSGEINSCRLSPLPTLNMLKHKPYFAWSHHSIYWISAKELTFNAVKFLM